MPNISIIMSTYNDENYLSESIDSILSQSFEDFEFIIINDGSTDGTQMIIDEYAEKDCRIVSIYHENLGLTKSLNKGLKIASGEFIARQDSDDISHPDRIKRQYEFMEANTQTFVCFCWTKVIDELGDEIGEIRFSTKPERIKKTLKKGKNIYTHGSAMFRKKQILDLGGYSSEFKISQDFDLWLRLLNNNVQLGAVDSVLYNWRLNPNSISLMKSDEQRKSGMISLQNNVKMKNISVKKVRDPILHHYHNIYFRAQARTKILKTTYELIQYRELTMRELIKTIIAISPVNYKSIFQYL